jgi:hypothetical protein
MYIVKSLVFFHSIVSLSYVYCKIIEEITQFLSKKGLTSLEEIRLCSQGPTLSSTRTGTMAALPSPHQKTSEQRPLLGNFTLDECIDGILQNLGFNGFIWILKLFYELNLTGIYMDS